MKKTIITLIILGVLALASGCASGPKKEEVDRMALVENQLARILADLNELQREGRANSAAIAELRDEIKSELEELKTENAKQSVHYDTLAARIDAMNERLDDSELRITNMRKEVTNLRISRTGTVFARPSDADPALFENAEDMDDSEDTHTQIIPSSETEAYQLAYADFLRGDYNLSITGLRNYLQQYSNGTRTEDAQFYLAESYYNLGDFQSAVEEYDELINAYPETQYRLNAMYKKGLAFLDSNQTAQGVILLQRLVSQYPNSNEARLAKDKLKSLGLNP